MKTYFYSARLKDYQMWLGWDPQWNLIWPYHAEYTTYLVPKALVAKEESFQIKLKFKSKLIVSCFAEKVVAIFWILRNILNMKTATKYETLFYERALKM